MSAIGRNGSADAQPTQDARRLHRQAVHAFTSSLSRSQLSFVQSVLTYVVEYATRTEQFYEAAKAAKDAGANDTTLSFGHQGAVMSCLRVHKKFKKDIIDCFRDLDPAHQDIGDLRDLCLRAFSFRQNKSDFDPQSIAEKMDVALGFVCPSFRFPVPPKATQGTPAGSSNNVMTFNVT